ncbi:MAG: FAD-dependent oxidoreductase [Deltaproteobacteria bacterium]|nr:FAD-dependent oxidoreductase [Deltaproteobacteria bacterium]
MPTDHTKVGAISVIGGGIAGMQAALDAANAGFKVYLVEKDISIGGVMAQLDKTFPTNDCSTCLISPKLIEVARHPDIEIVTQSEVAAVAGEAGHFTVTLRQEPRYIDRSKCNACGACSEACPVELPSAFDENLGKRHAAFRHFPQAIPATFAIKKLDRAPCVRACPANLTAQGYVQLVKAGKFPEALSLIMDRLPLPGTIGRICPHPCETDCRRQEVDEPVAICSLKRFVADAVDWTELPAPEVSKRPEAVAIIGAGPSGLSCAYHLACQGYKAVIFEASAAAGGWLRYGIPEYRLPKEVLQREVDYIQRLGVEINYNSPIGGPGRTIDDLLTQQGFRAVYLGVGAQDSIRLPVPGAEADGVLWGVEYLKDTASGNEFDFAGLKVTVIGGGNVAMDVARTARRQGGEVTLIALETREEMPASPWEVAEAEQEGVQIVHRWGVKQVLAREGKCTGVELRAVERVFDEQGRFAPTYLDEKTSTRDSDIVILAIGQRTNLKFITEADGIKLTPRGLIEADPETLATSREGVFAGGDVVSGPYIAIAAVAAGREAAISIDRYLNGQDLKAGREKPLRPIPKEEGNWTPIPAGTAKKRRAEMPELPQAAWTSGFKEINLGFSESEAMAEAERCLNCGGCSECLQCVAACQAGAIDHQMPPGTRQLEVGAMILAPGFRPFDAGQKPEYGYGRYPNVVTSLQFERILSATGPFGGHVQRPGDGAAPRKVAWIQCVGSRDASCGREYCSYVCCMYATKQAIIAREHDHNIEPTIFYIDLRAQGKGFDRYCERARNDHGVRYVRAMISRVAQDPGSQDLELSYVDEAGQVQTEIFEMVVLSVGLNPHPATKQLAANCAIATDRYGFAVGPPLELVSTSRPGIFTCGVFQSPKDIPETVGQASGAAGAAASLLAEARGTLVTKEEYPPEKEISGEAPRIGIFICHCGINIAGVVDVAAVADYARTLPGVVYTDHYTFTCATDSLDKMRQVIETENLNRVVVASCSPRTHEPLFQENLRKAGLNKYLFEMANIRDQDSWVHQGAPDAATAKAKELVRMAAARAAILEPLGDLLFPVSQQALVVGGGLAGLTAALTIADGGYQVYLTEPGEPLAASLARGMRRTLEGHEIQPYLKELVRRVEDHPKIEWLPNTHILDVSGHIGKFRSTLESAGFRREIEYGAVVMATGGEEYEPEEYLYCQDSRVLTQTEMENLLGDDPAALSGVPTVAMIQCVGSRSPEHQYCSRTCCGDAIKNAITIKEINPAAQVFVLYRDIRTYGLKEIYYKKARDLGVVFVRFEPERKPEVKAAGQGLEIQVFDQSLQAELTLKADFLVLSAAIRPHPVSKEIAKVFKLPFDADGFFMEAHLKLRPLDFASSGIFLCGLAHGPKFLDESLAQAKGAAARALGVLSQQEMYVAGSIAQVDPLKCVACLTCVRTCPFGVPRMDESEGVAFIDPASCQGCGNCASACPRKAIAVKHNLDEQFIAKIGAISSPWTTHDLDDQLEAAGGS